MKLQLKDYSTCARSRIDHEEEYLRYVRVLENSLRKLKKEVSMNHLMDLVQYLGPDSDCLFINVYKDTLH
ncbi:hypothetical protein Avbf_19022 [Armadillidium vulgare]|nr:hypothetical protein Avbf_19022 [Armadillidium vulgare]